jgi:hypothetical protein
LAARIHLHIYAWHAWKIGDTALKTDMLRISNPPVMLCGSMGGRDLDEVVMTLRLSRFSLEGNAVGVHGLLIGKVACAADHLSRAL